MTQWRANSNSWMSISVWPLDCGRYPELRLTLAPRTVQKVYQTCEVNWGLLSGRIFVRILWRLKIWPTRSLVVSEAEGSLSRAIKWADLKNLLNIERITDFLEEGRPVTELNRILSAVLASCIDGAGGHIVFNISFCSPSKVVTLD